ncbi:hypothetical protein B0H13DRAFT_1988350 [Mycena leptocephala]|nr:hypothetical protein B0H13DRAFT_1988350 [Mycena leptocephala]
MMNFVFFTLTAAAALTAVSAASIPRDDSCGSSLESLVTSSDPGLNCLAPTALKDVFALGTKKNASVDDVKNTVSTWLTDFCGVGTCSADTVNKISTSVNASCSVDTFNTTDFAGLRESLCLKDTVANTFCTVESLSQGSTDTNSTDTASPGEVMLAIFLASSTLFSPCNECAKAQYQLGVKAGNTDFQVLNDRCGANFTATLNSTVVGVAQTAVTTEFKNAAGPLAPTAGMLLIAMSGLFALL